jgi:AraC-like DNA-binding protein
MDISDLIRMPDEDNLPSFVSRNTREGKYLFLDLNPPERSGITLVGAGREVCTADYKIERTSFEYHSIEFIVGGTWKVTHKGNTELLRPGAIFAYGPGTAYTMEAAQGDELIKYFISFTGDDAFHQINECGLSHCAVLYANPSRWIQDLYDQLIDCRSLEVSDAWEIGGQLTELIIRRIRTDTYTGEDRRSEGYQTFARCRAFIYSHYMELGSIEEVAKHCHIDPAYLARLFKRFSNERPLHLLTRLKTQYAADLIMRQGYSVAMAGQAVGFPDPYHFSRVFKRIHGVAPRKIFRRD